MILKIRNAHFSQNFKICESVKHKNIDNNTIK